MPPLLLDDCASSSSFSSSHTSCPPSPPYSPYTSVHLSFRSQTKPSQQKQVQSSRMKQQQPQQEERHQLLELLPSDLDVLHAATTWGEAAGVFDAAAKYTLPGKLPATFVLSSIAANPVNTLPPPDYTPFTFFGAMFAVWMHMDDTVTCTHWRPEVIPFRLMTLDEAWCGVELHDIGVAVRKLTLDARVSAVFDVARMSQKKITRGTVYHDTDDIVVAAVCPASFSSTKWTRLGRRGAK